MNQFLRSAAALLLGAACGVALAQKIDDVPPAVQNGVAPNFMFMLDNSGSMNNIVPAVHYSATGSDLASCPSPAPVASGSVIWVKVVNGAPRFTIGNANGPGTTTYRHTTVSASGITGYCFDNTRTYAAKLYADTSSTSGGTTTRQPGTGWLDADYSGHFLNWYLGNYDGPVTGWGDRKAVSSGAVETRIEIAKRAAKSAIDSLPLTGASGRAAVRAGLSTYRSGGGALLVAMGDLTATTRTTLKNSIDALTPGGATPLATTLADIGRYLSTGYNGTVTTAVTASVDIDTLLKIDGTDNAPRNACLSGAPTGACRTTTATAAQKPIQNWCQRSSIFAMTDGRPQSDRGFDNNPYVRDYDGDCSGANSAACGLYDRKNNRSYESQGSDYMDDVAKLLFDVDWRPDLAKPAPVPPAIRAKNNISTYVIGFADPAVQNDPLLLNTARQGGGKFIAATDGPSLTEAFRDVMTDALAKDAAAAAVAVTNAQITAGSVGYASSYNSGSWYGDLEAYSLDTGTGLQNGAVAWSARERLNAQAAASRKIVSFDGTKGVPFTTDQGGTFRARAPTLSDSVINYTRGSRAGEGSTFRARSWLLGDIINAEPVVVNYATGAVVYQAANDGMLHAFDGRIDASVATRGQELWAYVPALVHPRLAARADRAFQHEFIVDATPATDVVTVGSTTTRILAGGLGKGGAGFYALDITDGAAADEAAAANKVLWEFRPANMGYSFGTPLVVKTRDGWRVVVTSGLRNDAGSGGLGGDGRGHVWVLHPTTGAIEKEFLTPAGFDSSSTPLGLAHLARASNLASGSTVRYLWGGDLQGNVWRFDLDAATSSTAVRVAQVKAPDGSTQPITVPMVVAPVPGSASRYYLYFGTGQYFSVDDVPGTSTPNAYATQVETIYGVVDDTAVAAPALPDIRRNNGANCPGIGGNGDFTCQTATQDANGTFTVSHNPVDLSSRRGFYLDVPVSGARVNTQAALTRGGTLVVIANRPSNVTCDPGGTSFLFQLSSATGGAVVKTYGGSDYFTGGYALASALSSRGVIVTSSTGPRALLRLSDKTTQSRKIDETAGSSPAFRRIYMRPLN
jgi:type IV pilus assembly protein PilY1